MSREFRGPVFSDQVGFNLGAATFGQGPITIACLIKPTSTTGTRRIIEAATAAIAETYGILIDSGTYFCVSLFANGPAAPTNDWQWIAFSKATGTVTPRFHFRNVTAAGAWSHTNPAGTANNGVTPPASLTVGAFNSTGFYQGLIAALAIWGTQLSDGQVEAACTLAASDLAASTPAWGTLWNQGSVATPVPDFTGNGGNQLSISGTLVNAEDPPGFNYSLVSTVSGTGLADLGALGATASGTPIVGGIAAGSLGSLDATGSGLVTVPGAALADLGRLNATASVNPPDPDQFVSVLMNQLLTCLCEQANRQPNPPAICCFRVGTEIAHDAGILEDQCCEGIGYVALGDTYPSSESFPDADIIRQANSACAPATWAQVFQVGIIRCAPVGNEFRGPNCTEWNDAGRQNVVDQQTLRRVACCIRDFVISNDGAFMGMSLVIDRQVQGNPQGGCVERTMKITAQFPNCDC